MQCCARFLLAAINDATMETQNTFVNLYHIYVDWSITVLSQLGVVINDGDDDDDVIHNIVDDINDKKNYWNFYSIIILLLLFKLLTFS